MEQAVIGETLARRGFLDYLEPFTPRPQRAPCSPASSWPRVPPRNFLQKAIKWENLPLPGIYLGRLFDQAETSSSHTQTRLSRFLSGTTRPAWIPSWHGRSHANQGACPGGRPVPGLSPGPPVERGSDLPARRCWPAGEHSRTQTLPAPKKFARGKKMMSIRFANVKTKPQLRMKEEVPEMAYELKFMGLLEDFQMGYPITPKVLREIEHSAAACSRQCSGSSGRNCAGPTPIRSASATGCAPTTTTIG